MDRQQLHTTLSPATGQGEQDVENPLAPDWLAVLDRQEWTSFHDLESLNMKEWVDDFQEFRVCSQRAAQMVRQVRSRPDRMGAVHPSGFSISQIPKKNQKRVTFNNAPSTTRPKRSTDEHTHRQKAADDSQPTHLTTARVEMPPSRSSTTSTSLAISRDVENQINQQAVASNLHRPASIAAPAAPLQTHPPASPADAHSPAMAIAAPAAPLLPNPSSVVAPTAQLSANPSDKPTVSRANHRRARCDCNCGCSQTYYARKSGASIRCAPCIKGKKTQCAELSQASTQTASSQVSNPQSQMPMQGLANLPHPSIPLPVSSAGTTAVGTVSGPTHSQPQPQHRTATELQQTSHTSNQSTVTDLPTSQAFGGGRLHSAAADDHKQGAGKEESHGVGQTGQTASKPAKTVSADQGRGPPHSDEGKRRIPDDDDELEHALAESMNKRARTGDTESGGKQENDGWKRSF
ncbi:hypothetical protein LTR56_021793 [Elasticomyces elasticus]|nr:hypothetical protein LTR56_021793 [Elasticomyces elasticus]KAK3630549.1 hypothetical protein LTR22_021465 [Elasticomyces elasticus]KAK4909066.1 hypothetical protein LTR49_022106 [Elasticomyces elasticus]KAK5748469.1 hypothetical protein LTS12_021488 [Elasticomyces elasticus]